jgi:hypothetical protein
MCLETVLEECLFHMASWSSSTLSQRKAVYILQKKKKKIKIVEENLTSGAENSFSWRMKVLKYWPRPVNYTFVSL